MHFLPKTKQGLIDWLKLPNADRLNDLRPYCGNPLHHYTSPLCVLTGQSIEYHVDAVLDALHGAESILELPYNVILFFPNYDILLAAFTVAKNKWDIYTATQYAMAQTDKLWYYNETIGGRAYPYIHWLPRSGSIRITDYTVTSAHYPFLGNRTSIGKARVVPVPKLKPKLQKVSKPIIYDEEDEDL